MLARASRAALRAVAGCAQPAGAEMLADAPAKPKAEDLQAWRGRVDAIAIRARFSDAAVHHRLAPDDETLCRLFDALEQARVESKVSPTFAGIRVNLAAWYAVNTAHEYAGLIGMARQIWGAPLWPVAPATPTEPSAAVSQQLASMRAMLDHQQLFGIAALELLRSMPVVAREARHDHRNDDGPGATAVPSGTATALAKTGLPGGDHASTPVTPAEMPRGSSEYRVYAREFDRVVDASELIVTIQAADGDATRAMRRLQVEESRARLQRWACRLQRHLQVRAPRVWSFDEEEGQLDAARLTRLLTNPLAARPFKRLSPASEREAAITMLVDCSGSMRGRPMAIAAGCIHSLVPVLERCGVMVELLGFTTRAWRGGNARAKWLSEGRSLHPGRLNDVLHIVFKRGDMRWRRARAGVEALLEDTNLKENIDGEALLWAYGRLVSRPERRRILLVLSDGAPSDDATLKANDPDYLDRHLRAVIRTIEAGQRVELLAIGIGHDVGKHYARAFTVSNPADLGEAMVTQLAALLGDSSSASCHS